MPTVHVSTVRRAAEIVGGVEGLAVQLEVRHEFIKKWMEGQLPVPQKIFLRCVDIVNAHQIKEISGRYSNSSNSGPKPSG
jgi:hypothetical protein